MSSPAGALREHPDYATNFGQGYLLVGNDWGIYAFGNAQVYGAVSIYGFGNGSSQHWFGGNIVGIAAAPNNTGYWIASNNGVVCNFGSVGAAEDVNGTYSWQTTSYCWQQFAPGSKTNIVAIQATPDGGGYWLAGSDGAVYSFGDAGNSGSAYSFNSNPDSWIGSTFVGIATASQTKTSGYYDAYWINSANTVVCNLGTGDVNQYGTWNGETGWQTNYANYCWWQYNYPPTVTNIVGMANTPDSGGYWLVGSDGGIFAYGDAGFYGSMGATPLAKPIVGIAPTPDGQGYIEAASDGGIFTFGDAAYQGALAGQTLSGSIVGITEE